MRISTKSQKILKRKKSGLKNTITEMKNSIEEVNSRLSNTEDCISHLGDRIVVPNWYSKKFLEKKCLRDLWEQNRIENIKSRETKRQNPPPSFIYLAKIFPHVYRTQSCLTICNPVHHVPRQAPVSIGLSRKEYWSGLPFPPPGNLPNPGIEAVSPVSPALVGGLFMTEPPEKAQNTP